jgi:hypothetical protein
MGNRKPRAAGGKRRQQGSARASRTATDAGVAAALGEIQRVLDTPLAELMESDEERAAAQALTEDALAVPAIVRLGKLVAFVGEGRPVTQAGNLKAPDAVAVARLLARAMTCRARSARWTTCPTSLTSIAGRSPLSS